MAEISVLARIFVIKKSELISIFKGVGFFKLQISITVFGRIARSISVRLARRANVVLLPVLLQFLLALLPLKPPIENDIYAYFGLAFFKSFGFSIFRLVYSRVLRAPAAA